MLVAYAYNKALRELRCRNEHTLKRVLGRIYSSCPLRRQGNVAVKGQGFGSRSKE